MNFWIKILLMAAFIIGIKILIYFMSMKILKNALDTKLKITKFK